MFSERKRQGEEDFASTKAHLDAVCTYFLRTARTRSDGQGCVVKAEQTLRKVTKILSELEEALHQAPENPEPSLRTAKRNGPNIRAASISDDEQESSASQVGQQLSVLYFLYKVFFLFACSHLLAEIESRNPSGHQTTAIRTCGLLADSTASC